MGENILWFDISKKEAECLAEYGLVEGEYPALDLVGDYVVPYPEDKANYLFMLRRFGDVVQFGIPDDEFDKYYDEGDLLALDIVSYDTITGCKEDASMLCLFVYVTNIC